ncbi:MAG: hypothetical protein JO235_06570 [Chroococcidiopsidaceae cyanobacterium CP_BM_RX_35]|nr:hypothetical protein [Chroococcidiopsidaceae cyanobacterium CP_BM_RX_35]
MTKEAALVSAIEQELALLQELMIQVQQLLELITETNNQNIRSGLVGGLALHLHSFYTGAERIFYDIARDIDDELPTGSNWHEQLLRQMNVKVPTVRQLVLVEQTRLELDEFRRFRHVVRSRYAYQLDPERVVELAQKLIAVNQHLLQDCQRFCTELKSHEQN